MASNQTHEMLEGENDRLMDDMARKIDTLKTVGRQKSTVHIYSGTSNKGR